MAKYLYSCNVCKKELEIEKSMNEEMDVTCDCGSKDTKRIYTPLGIVFKCNGFYDTDKDSMV